MFLYQFHIVTTRICLIRLALLLYSLRTRKIVLNGFVLIRHLNGTVLASFVRPAVLITDAYNALNNQPYRRGEKENEFGGTKFLRFKLVIPLLAHAFVS